MEVSAQFEEAVGEMRGRFVDDYYDSLDKEAIGDLIWLYHSTYGLRTSTSVKVINECIHEDIKKEWKGVVKEALVYCKKLEKEKK